MFHIGVDIGGTFTDCVLVGDSTEGTVTYGTAKALSTKADPALRTVREWAGARLADYKLPAELVIASALPRNASGKVIKKQLTAQLAEQRAGTRSPSAPART